MQSLWIYLTAFFQVVVVNCAEPENWQNCYRLDQWLIPDVIEGFQIWTERKIPYQEEKDYLKRALK